MVLFPFFGTSGLFCDGFFRVIERVFGRDLRRFFGFHFAGGHGVRFVLSFRSVVGTNGRVFRAFFLYCRRFSLRLRSLIPFGDEVLRGDFSFFREGIGLARGRGLLWCFRYPVIVGPMSHVAFLY